MDTPPLPPHPAHLPDWANDELPLLTETVGEPGIPLLSEVVPTTPRPSAPASPPAQAMATPPAASLASPPAAEPLAQIERELHAAAQLIMQEVIDDYMLQIEAELHRRLEEHLAKVLRAGRR
ncbi:DNA polymerase III subunit chi [Pseudomonas sp. MAP12]|uniref:DNA polymerase III subunit chi n=1 Tax=Geopseudomonas aromaticivorans TaxID=2849492 RepID=A0ABS6MYE0_9GAMM|nr:DNA polymerase III subunit chi [Pseudomonas aromaticivorans]MBV2133824.1 DNA polymerase III subunit chi [Pseudomonas aromaticivorans]